MEIEEASAGEDESEEEGEGGADVDKTELNTALNAAPAEESDADLQRPSQELG